MNNWTANCGPAIVPGIGSGLPFTCARHGREKSKTALSARDGGGKQCGREMYVRLTDQTLSWHGLRGPRAEGPEAATRRAEFEGRWARICAARDRRLMVLTSRAGLGPGRAEGPGRASFFAAELGRR